MLSSLSAVLSSFYVVDLSLYEVILHYTRCFVCHHYKRCFCRYMRCVLHYEHEEMIPWGLGKSFRKIEYSVSIKHGLWTTDDGRRTTDDGRRTGYKT